MSRHHVIRFMSSREARKLSKGEVVTNTTDHGAHGSKTNSRGFCFMVIDGRKTGMGYHTARYLTNIVDMDVMLHAIVDRRGFKVGWGHYADYDAPNQETWPNTVRTELSTTEYALSDFEHWAFYEPVKDIPDLTFTLATDFLVPKLMRCSCMNINTTKCKYNNRVRKI